MATTAVAHPPSAHALMAFHQRFAQEATLPITDVVAGNSVDLALRYVRVLVAASRHPARPTGISVNLDWAEIHPAPRSDTSLLRYNLFGAGCLDQPIPFFSVGQPTLATLSRLHGEALAVLDAALPQGSMPDSADPDTTWYALALEGAHNRRTEIWAGWHPEAALPWYAKLG